VKTETTPIKFTTLYGPLYIAIARANLHEYYRTGRGNVAELRPCLRVASDPAFEADPAAEDHWTIRGRAYAVHYKIYFEDFTGVEYDNGYQGERWHTDSAPYKGGFRNAKRDEVEFRTKTRDLMWEETVRALDTFDAQNPGWKNLSSYLYYLGQAASHESQAAGLRREAADHDTKALAFAADAATCAGGTPEPLLNLIKKGNN
jgi:hypothetical protein